MHAREHAHHKRDNNRMVRPFEWGLEYISDHVNGDDPRHVLTAVLRPGHGPQRRVLRSARNN